MQSSDRTADIYVPLPSTSAIYGLTVRTFQMHDTDPPCSKQTYVTVRGNILTQHSLTTKCHYKCSLNGSLANDNHTLWFAQNSWKPRDWFTSTTVSRHSIWPAKSLVSGTSKKFPFWKTEHYRKYSRIETLLLQRNCVVLYIHYKYRYA